VGHSPVVAIVTGSFSALALVVALVAVIGFVIVKRAKAVDDHALVADDSFPPSYMDDSVELVSEFTVEFSRPGTKLTGVDAIGKADLDELL
jgi:hypothetical protein